MSFTISRKEYYPKINQLYLKINTINKKIKEVKGWYINGNWSDAINFNVNYTSTNTFLRTFNVGLHFDTEFRKKITKFKNIGVKFGALKLGNAGQVISDIRFYNKVLNETNWDESLTPFGYGKWKIMITGDYIYTKALCKYSMIASLNADRPNTREYYHRVDVPDVIDRGTVVLTKTNQPYHVKFTPETVRFFHVVPELNVSIKSYSGTGETPLIIPYNVTTTGFDVVMKVGSGYVDGSITYSARGY